jgi:hypothetical protein
MEVMKVLQDFVSQEQRQFRFALGHVVASSLSGFLAGVVVTSIVWWIGVTNY